MVVLKLYWPKYDKISFFTFLQKKVFRLVEKCSCTFYVTREVLPHDICIQEIIITKVILSGFVHEFKGKNICGYIFQKDSRLSISEILDNFYFIF